MIVILFRIQDFHFILSSFPTEFCYNTKFHFNAVPNPYRITTISLGSYPFARHYLGNR